MDKKPAVKKFTPKTGIESLIELCPKCSALCWSVASASYTEHTVQHKLQKERQNTPADGSVFQTGGGFHTYSQFDNICVSEMKMN